MRRICIVLVGQVLFVQSLFAEPITLKCETDTGTAAADLIIDIDNRLMSWAHQKYDIFNITDKYISAYLRSSDIGGEVWVIDRTTGMYKRGAVGIYCATDCSPEDSEVFLSQTYEGKCVRQQF